MCEERRDFPRHQRNASKYLRKENGEKVVVLVASDESQTKTNQNERLGTVCCGRERER